MDVYYIICEIDNLIITQKLVYSCQGLTILAVVDFDLLDLCTVT
jgi:hypothetical protein